MRRASLLRIAALAMGLCAVPASAEVFDAAIAQDSISVSVNGPLSRLLDVDKGEYALGGVTGDIEDFDDDRFYSLHAGALLSGDAGGGSVNVRAGLGARLQYVDADVADGGALALGGTLRASLPQATRLGLGASLWYGPDAAAFGDFDEILEWSVTLGYELLRDAELYLGYRGIQVGVDGGGNVDLEDAAHVGIRLQF